MEIEFAVEFVSVTKRFGEVVAVQDLTLQIRDGEFFSLLGPSGCGKTTSLRMIGGFEMPSEGEVYIGGQAQGFTPAYQRPVNTVFQNYALFPHMTVYENVAFGLQMRKFEKAGIRTRVEQALEMVRLSGMDHRKPSQLSGGQQQRVALARALINTPKVLLLDEPLGALDLKLRKAMQLELKELQQRVGITFVYVTHDQEEALTMSDRIGVMRGGELLQVGTPLEVYEDPATRFVADFIGDSNYLEGEALALKDGMVEVEIAPRVRVVAPASTDLQVGKRLTVAFRPEKVMVNPVSSQHAAENRLTCTLKDIVYTGSFTTYLLQSPVNTELMARQQNDREYQTSSARPGDPVTIAWPVDLTKSFPETRQG